MALQIFSAKFSHFRFHEVFFTTKILCFLPVDFWPSCDARSIFLSVEQCLPLKGTKDTNFILYAWLLLWKSWDKKKHSIKVEEQQKASIPNSFGNDIKASAAGSTQNFKATKKERKRRNTIPATISLRCSNQDEPLSLRSGAEKMERTAHGESSTNFHGSHIKQLHLCTYL